MRKQHKGNFKFFRKILGDISKFATGINNTGSKFATGVNDTGGKFATMVTSGEYQTLTP
jgi:hypothetical protein